LKIGDKVDTHWIYEAEMKDAGLRIRVEQQLRDDFVAACRKMDIPAAQVLRQHMRAVVEKVEKRKPSFQNKSKHS
jgi:hypothetical protein